MFIVSCLLAFFWILSLDHERMRLPDIDRYKTQKIYATTMNPN